jgi:hypothetical protein
MFNKKSLNFAVYMCVQKRLERKRREERTGRGNLNSTQPTVVAHAYNPSYWGHGNQEDPGLKAA